VVGYLVFASVARADSSESKKSTLMAVSHGLWTVNP
jgi:hypothetical protein